MALARGTVSYTAYRVMAAPGPDLRAVVLDGLIRGRISTMDVALGRDRTTGFAVFADPLDTDFTEEKVFWDHLVVFSLRTDRLVVPSSTLRLHIRRRVAEVLAATRRERLPREEREEIADAVRVDLLRRTLPAITAYEVVWDTRSDRVRLSTTSQALADDFTSRVREFLGLELQPLNLVGVLESRLDEEERAQVYHLLPSTFVPATPSRRGRRDWGGAARGRGEEEDEA